MEVEGNMAEPVMPALGRLRQLETSRGYILRPFLNKQANVPCPHPLTLGQGFLSWHSLGAAFPLDKSVQDFRCMLTLTLSTECQECPPLLIPQSFL